MPINITQTIMPAMPATLLYPQASGCKIEFIMKNKNIVGGDFVKPRHLGNRQARFVHIALRFYQNNFVGANAANALQSC